jgi:hypothetical protein
MSFHFDCEVQAFPSPYFAQIYEGLEILRKKGWVNLTVTPELKKQDKPVLKMILNRKHVILYDGLDGINWVDGSLEDNIQYFRNNIKADFYFKRSFHQTLKDNAPNGCQVFPLGLNYTFFPERNFFNDSKSRMKHFIGNSFLSSFFKHTAINSSEFEYPPIRNEKFKILFLTKFWNPDDIDLDHLKTEREVMNRNRAEFIRACRREFGDRFIGGVDNSSFSEKFAKDLIMDAGMTNKKAFLKTVKESNVCISTAGLHDSIGWKFGEYVAASRAIVSEPLAYGVPGDFHEDRNYLVFRNTDMLIEKVSLLVNDKNALAEMMTNNYRYYNNYVKPENLVLNTLLTVDFHTK